MRKPQLATVISEETGLNKDKANEVLNAILDTITQAVDSQSVTLVGFGTFEKRHRGARNGKNPQTGEALQIKASNTVAFKPGKAFRDLLHGDVTAPSAKAPKAAKPKASASSSNASGAAKRAR
ncbi:HU family DNA-binding protein [Pseudomonas monteilii]|jgi:DNA-binding protein HU-alpha|uniref:HU family DNA-binding protein n=1 Tax=Pseudomonas alabamensis TaxID=3064349 RepID=UPI0021D89E74|nr:MULTISPECIES: HU family DNA-binding protein [Pseudomonas]MDO7909706.1 HU family DNA-binding protein [Pseudomonas sp. 22-AL-CL-001]